MYQKMKNRLKEQRGFTLVELLAVIVILGIIAAIAVPSVMSVMNNSKEDAVKADAIQVYNAVKLYAADNGISSAESITWDEIKSYVDTNYTTDESKTKYKLSSFNATISSTGEVKLYGSITGDGKTINFGDNGATIEQIQGVDEFTENTASING